MNSVWPIRYRPSGHATPVSRSVAAQSHSQSHSQSQLLSQPATSNCSQLQTGREGVSWELGLGVSAMQDASGTHIDKYYNAYLYVCLSVGRSICLSVCPPVCRRQLTADGSDLLSTDPPENQSASRPDGLICRWPMSVGLWPVLC